MLADTAAVETLGPVMESHERFPERANIGFMQVVGRSAHIRHCASTNAARENQACGSDACAAVAVGIQRGLLAETVRVELPGGRWRYRLERPGPAAVYDRPGGHVYDGLFIYETNRGRTAGRLPAR